MFFFISDTGLLIQERKRPRKLSHRVLECAIEEVAAAPMKKKVCLDFDGCVGVYQPAIFERGEKQNSPVSVLEKH